MAVNSVGATRPECLTAFGDQTLLRESLAALLEQQDDFQMVGSASDGLQTCQLARSTKIDVLLLDIRMPLMDGLQVLQELKQEHFPGRIVMLTMYQDEESSRPWSRRIPVER